MRGWSIDDIRRMNPSGARSQIDALLDMAAASEGYLEEVADILDDCAEPSILASFQLPVQLQLDKEPYCVPGLGSNVRFLFRSRSHKVVCDQLGRTRLFSECEYPNRASEGVCNVWSAPITSFIVTSPLWGSRAEFYSRYEALMTTHGPRNGIVVPEHLSWDRHMAMNTSRFEANLIRRAQSELFYAIKIFLKAVRLQTLRRVWSGDDVSGLFWMTYPGLLRRIDLPRPILSSILTQYRASLKPIETGDLTQAIKSRHREESEFELSLLEAERLKSVGETRSGFLHAFILMEEMVKQEALQHVKDLRLQRIKEGKDRLMAGAAIKILQSAPEPWPDAFGDLDQMDALREIRNALAHEASKSPADLEVEAAKCIALARRMFRNRNRREDGRYGQNS